MDIIRTKLKSETANYLDDGTMEVIVNSGKIDRQGEILDIKGLDLANYMENPVVAWGHNYAEPAIGKATKIWKDPSTGALKATVKFAIEISDMAKLIYNLIKGGYMNAFSIGFIPFEAEEDKDGNVVYTKSEMLEFSAVLVPADPRALATAKSLYGDVAVKALTGEISSKEFHFKKNEVEEKEIAEVVEVVEKSGRVLNKSNRKLLTDAVIALQAVIDADNKEEAPEKGSSEKSDAGQAVDDKSLVKQSGRAVSKKKTTRIIYTGREY